MTDTTAPTGAIEAKTDRELLELAAKAAGYAVEIKDGKACAYGEWLPSTSEPDAGIYWNPLLDCGDAFRLAVKLYLWEAIRLAHREVSAEVDIYAATRRCIVRAAAAIGRSL